MKSKTALLEKKIGYDFRNPSLLLQALTHSSYANEAHPEQLEDNEVFEFLGDAVFDLVCAHFLVTNFPSLGEGDLSKLRSAAASTSSLSDLAKKMRLDKHIRLGRGEEKSGGRKKRTILAGVFEAVVAAVYLDGGLDETRRFLLRYLEPFFRQVNVEKFLINNYKSALQEMLQSDNLPAPLYRNLTAKGPDHRRKFTVEVMSNGRVMAKASGSSRKDAEQKAAQKALKSLLGHRLKSLTPETFLLKKHD